MSGEETPPELPPMETVKANNPRRLSRRSFLKAGAGALAFLAGATKDSPDRFSNQIPPLPEFEHLEGDQKVLVVLAKQKDKQAPISLQEEEEIMQKVADFFHRSSYKKLNLSFKVLGWQDIDQDLNFKNPYDVSKAVDEKISELEVAKNLPKNLKPNDFQTRLYVVDQTGKGSISGNGIHKDPYNQAWVYQSEYTGGIGATLHELGHTLGLDHVDGYGCQARGDYTNNCTTSAASSRSIMGNDYRPTSSDIAAPQKFYLGWISPDQVETVVSDTSELVLTPNEVNDRRTKLVRIRKPDTNEFYYIEYSTPQDPNYDPSLNFYIWDEKTSNLKHFAATGSYYSHDGDEFFDNINGIQVRQLRHSKEEAAISVKFK